MSYDPHVTEQFRGLGCVTILIGGIFMLFLAVSSCHLVLPWKEDHPKPAAGNPLPPLPIDPPAPPPEKTKALEGDLFDGHGWQPKSGRP